MLTLEISFRIREISSVARTVFHMRSEELLNARFCLILRPTTPPTPTPTPTPECHYKIPGLKNVKPRPFSPSSLEALNAEISSPP